jgi:phosphatidylglycerophosphate synthase
MQTDTENRDRFAIELLMALQRSHFSIQGWGTFLLHSWEKAQMTARTNPALRNSWCHVTLLLSLIAIGICIGVFFSDGTQMGLSFLPGFLFCFIWQQSDLYWHLGLHRNPKTYQLFHTVGLANTLTWLRALCASFLLARLIGGLHTSSLLAFSVFLFSVVTDMLDGLIARQMSTQSRLGQIADGEADFCLYLAITCILFQNQLLAPWIACVMILRFFMPFLAVLSSYFVLARPVRFGSTCWGKYAGVAQGCYFVLLLAPGIAQPLTQRIQGPVLLVTLVLLCIAPIAQIQVNYASQSEK